MLIGPLGLVAGAEAGTERQPELADLTRAKSSSMSLTAEYCWIAVWVLGNSEAILMRQAGSVSRPAPGSSQPVLTSEHRVYSGGRTSSGTWRKK